MKIDGIKNKPISSKTVKKKAGSMPNISFVNMLESQLSPPSEASSANAAETISESSSASSSTRLAGLTLSDKTIDVLAQFSEALENLSLSSESLKPIIEELEEETTALLDIKEQLQDDDPLAELLDRIAAVAYLETEKYRRGDYDSR